MESKSKTFICTKIKLYDYLSKHGYMPIGSRTDKFNPKHLVWIYEDTEELRKSIDAYYAERQG